MPRPKDKPPATTAANSDTFLVDGDSGVRAMSKTNLVADLAANLPIVTRSARGMVPPPGGSGATRFFREDGTFQVPATSEGGAPGPAGGYRFMDRASAVAATDIPLVVKVIETESYSDTRRGKGGAKYRRISSAPVEAMHTNPAFIHAASDVNVSGGSWWQIVPDEGGFNYFQFGAVNDGSWNYQTATDNTPMMLKFQQYMYSDYGWFEDIRELRVSPGWYAHSKAIILKGNFFRIKGHQVVEGERVCAFTFPAGECGIIAHYGNTAGDKSTNQVFEGANAGNSSGTEISGMTLWGAGAGGNYAAYGQISDGVLMRSKCTIRNCWIGGFGRHGIYIATSADADPEGGNNYPAGNANNWRVYDCTLWFNGGSGIKANGADSNAGLAIGLDCTFNGWWAIEDQCFLGNSYFGCHAMDCGIGWSTTALQIGGPGTQHHRSGGFVTYAGKTYVAVAPQGYEVWNSHISALSTTTPGTNELVWQLYSNGVYEFARPWVSGQIFIPNGPYLGTGWENRSLFMGSYSEGSQAPNQFYGRSVVIGGLNTSAGLLAGSYGDINVDLLKIGTSRNRTFDFVNGAWNALEVSINDGAASPHPSIDRVSYGTVAGVRDGTPNLYLERKVVGNDIVTASSGNDIDRQIIQVGSASTLALDMEDDPLESGTTIINRLAIGIPSSFNVQQAKRIRIVYDNQLNNYNWAFGDIALYRDNFEGRLQKGGYIGRICLVPGIAGSGAAQFADFGHIPLKYTQAATIPELVNGAATAWELWTPANNQLAVGDALLMTFIPADPGATDNIGVLFESVVDRFSRVRWRAVNKSGSTTTLGAGTLVVRAVK